MRINGKFLIGHGCVVEVLDDDGAVRRVTFESNQNPTDAAIFAAIVAQRPRQLNPNASPGDWGLAANADGSVHLDANGQPTALYKTDTPPVGTHFASIPVLPGLGDMWDPATQAFVTPAGFRHTIELQVLPAAVADVQTKQAARDLYAAMRGNDPAIVADLSMALAIAMVNLSLTLQVWHKAI